MTNEPSLSTDTSETHGMLIRADWSDLAQTGAPPNLATAAGFVGFPWAVGSFEKFLVDRDGKVIARFAPKVQPDASEVVAAITTALAK